MIKHDYKSVKRPVSTAFRTLYCPYSV